MRVLVLVLVLVRADGWMDGIQAGMGGDHAGRARERARRDIGRTLKNLATSAAWRLTVPLREAGTPSGTPGRVTVMVNMTDGYVTLVCRRGGMRGGDDGQGERMEIEKAGNTRGNR